MVKKAALALCSMALLAVAFALPASAQNTKTKVTGVMTPGGMMAVGTYKTVNVRPPQPPPPANFFNMYDNFGTQVPLFKGQPAPNTNLGGINGFTSLLWQPGGWLIMGPSDPSSLNTIGGQAIAVPFQPGAACGEGCSISSIEIPVQQTANPGTTEEFAVSVWADDGVGVPTTLMNNNNTITGFVHIDADPVFPVCCLLINADIATYSPLLTGFVAGEGYWVVVDADIVESNPAAVASENVWAFSQGSNYGLLSPGYNTGLWCAPSSTINQCDSGGLPLNHGLTTGGTLPAMKITGHTP